MKKHIIIRNIQAIEIVGDNVERMFEREYTDRGVLCGGYRGYQYYDRCTEQVVPGVIINDIGKEWNNICIRCLVRFHKSVYGINYFNKFKDTQKVLDAFHNDIFPHGYKI